jgi:hypothetical protein
MTIMQILRSLHAVLTSCALGLLASSMPVGAATPPAPSASAPPRLTVADLMGTWKIFARTPMGGDFLPAVKAQNDGMIGKKILFTKKYIKNTFLYVLPNYIKNPIYSVEYKEMHPDTPYPEILWIKHPYSPDPYTVVYFKVGYMSKTEKKVIYTDFEVGSNYKMPKFALSLDMGNGSAFFLCKLNPKTGQCQDHP